MDNEQRKTDRLIESDIIHTLKSIGFPESLESWQRATPMIDPDGQTLRLLGHPVMERWEEPYMKKLAEIATSKASSLVAGGGGRFWNSDLGWVFRPNSYKATHLSITSSLR